MCTWKYISRLLNCSKHSNRARLAISMFPMKTPHPSPLQESSISFPSVQDCEPLSLRRLKVLKTSQVLGSALSEWHRCEPNTQKIQWPKLRTSSIALSECGGTVLLPACSLGPASQCWPCTGLLSYTTQGEEKLSCQAPADIVSSSCCSRAWNSSSV